MAKSPTQNYEFMERRVSLWPLGGGSARRGDRATLRPADTEVRSQGACPVHRPGEGQSSRRSHHHGSVGRCGHLNPGEPHSRVTSKHPPPTPPQLHTLGKSSAGKESSSHRSRVSHAGHPVPFPHTRRGLGVMHCPQEESQASSVRRPTPVSPPAPDSIS